MALCLYFVLCYEEAYAKKKIKTELVSKSAFCITEKIQTLQANSVKPGYLI